MDRHFTKLQEIFHLPDLSEKEPGSMGLNLYSPFSVSMTKRSWYSTHVIDLPKNGYIPKKHNMLCDIIPKGELTSNIIIKSRDKVIQELDFIFCKIWMDRYSRLPLFFGHDSRSYLYSKYLDGDNQLSITGGTEDGYKTVYNTVSNIEANSIAMESDYRNLLGRFWEPVDEYKKELNDESMFNSIMIISNDKINKLTIKSTFEIGEDIYYYDSDPMNINGILDIWKWEDFYIYKWTNGGESNSFIPGDVKIVCLNDKDENVNCDIYIENIHTQVYW